MGMRKQWKNLVTGKYTLYQDTDEYAQESFEINLNQQTHHTIFHSYLFSRSETGEVIKIFCDYELNEQFSPVKVTLQKNIGKESVEEVYRYNQKDNVLTYTFNNAHETHTEQKNIFKKFAIQTPCVLTSAFFSLYKKADFTARQSIALIKSLNRLEYAKPLQEEVGHISYEFSEQQVYQLNQSSFNYIDCSLYSQDLQQEKQQEEKPIKFQISKKFALPYAVIYNEHISMKLTSINVHADLGDQQL